MARYLPSLTTIIVIASFAFLPCASPLARWRVYAFDAESFVLDSRLLTPAPQIHRSTTAPRADMPAIPAAWQVSAALMADVTGDGAQEWVLIVWRPWQDWPIQAWTTAPSPIAGYHDAAGDSCHLILLDPRTGREIWAGSALPAPLLALAVGDVDGDGRSELAALEGDYATGRAGPASHVNVWRWNGFGFSLQWRSAAGSFRRIFLTPAHDGSKLNIATR